MPTPLKSLTAGIALATMSLCHSIAYADIAEVVTSEGDVMTFEYEGNMLRINPGQSDQGYMLMRDKKMYVVTDSDGQPMVFDMSSAMKMFGSMAESATPSTVETKVISLKATGKSETLAGIKGEVYELHYIDHEGDEQRADMVLSDNALARGFRDAIQNMAMTLANSLDKDTFNKQMKAGENLQDQLSALNKGVLRYGQDMELRSLKDSKVDPQRFVLPAQPTDLGGMLSEAFGGAQGSGDSEGGILGAIFGGDQDKAEKKQPTSDKEEPSAGEAVGKAVGEAFNKLFGK